MNNPLMDITNVDTASLISRIVGEDPDVHAVLKVLDDRWRSIAAAVPTLGVIATIDQQPEEVVDKLAYQFHVDYYPQDASLELKRQIVKDSIRLHRVAGTRGAVEDVIRHIWGDGAIVSEWWEHGGEPGTFMVALTNEQTQANVTEFLRSIRHVKRATDHLTIATVNECDPGTLNWAAVYHEYRTYRLEA